MSDFTQIAIKWEIWDLISFLFHFTHRAKMKWKHLKSLRWQFGPNRDNLTPLILPAPAIHQNSWPWLVHMSNHIVKWHSQGTQCSRTVKYRQISFPPVKLVGTIGWTLQALIRLSRYSKVSICIWSQVLIKPSWKLFNTFYNIFTKLLTRMATLVWYVQPTYTLEKHGKKILDINKWDSCTICAVLYIKWRKVNKHW